jgi:hypothetical protein
MEKAFRTYFRFIDKLPRAKQESLIHRINSDFGGPESVLPGTRRWSGQSEPGRVD